MTQGTSTAGLGHRWNAGEKVGAKLNEALLYLPWLILDTLLVQWYDRLSPGLNRVL